MVALRVCFVSFVLLWTSALSYRELKFFCGFVIPSHWTTLSEEQLLYNVGVLVYNRSAAGRFYKSLWNSGLWHDSGAGSTRSREALNSKQRSSHWIEFKNSAKVSFITLAGLQCILSKREIKIDLIWMLAKFWYRQSHNMALKVKHFDTVPAGREM